MAATVVHKRTTPVPPHAFDYTAQSILELTERAITKTRKVEDTIAKLQPHECTFESVVLPLARNDVESETATSPASLMQAISTHKDVRDAATDCAKKISDFNIESNMRQDIYQALQHAQANTPRDSLDAASQRLLDQVLRDRRRAGLALSQADQVRFKELRIKISKLCIAFQKNCDEEKGYLLFSKEQLRGVPESVIDGYEQVEVDGQKKYKISHKTPDVNPVLDNAKAPETRKKAFMSYESRSKINVPLFNEIMELRKDASAVIGYKTWADYIIEPNMAKTAKTAINFLDDLHAKLKPIGEKEIEKLLVLKKQDCEEFGSPFDDRFYAWDYRYLTRLYVDKKFQLNDELVKQYLPVQHVVEKVLEIYQRILSVKITQVHDAVTWHEEVTVFAVWDQLDDDDNADGFIGYLYLDLFPREDKYGHAAVWDPIPRSKLQDGSLQYPIAVMVANLAKPTPSKPALLTHDTTVTFFHELGHAFHALLSKTKYGKFRKTDPLLIVEATADRSYATDGLRTARDYIECPSQMLENWCYHAGVLKSISKHYESGEAMTDDLIEKIIESQYLNQGLIYLRQLHFGKFDLLVHGQRPDDKPSNYTEVWNTLRREIALTQLVDEEDLPESHSSFDHLVGGYDAGYYGYLYSQSFSVDMYETVFKKDPLSAEAGLRYRREILQPGGEREEMDSLTSFLGRPPSSEAFMRFLLHGA